jgi:hypothetical protein
LSEKAFLHDFAGDRRRRRRAFSTRLTTEKTTNAAWRTKPSFYAVSSQDRTINPDLERFLA